MHFRMAVVGKNIAFSKSPFIHTQFAKILGLSIEYIISDVGDYNFNDVIHNLQAQGFTGCNITVPYKEAAFTLADMSSARAQLAAAANTFVFKQNGQIFADNTDGAGFIRDVRQNLGYDVAGKHILICGAGGAVRGILGPLQQAQPASITIANRSPKSDLSVCTYAELLGRSFDVLIDGTSVRDTVPPLPDSLYFNEHALVYDLKYNTAGPTPIMQWAKNKGITHIYDGIGMLVEQAALAFALWTGQTPATLPVIKALRAQS